MLIAGYLRRVAVLSFSNGLSKLLLLTGEVLLVQKTGAAMLGLFAICQGIVLTVGILCLIGTDYGVVQYMAIYQEEGRWRRLTRMVAASSMVGFAVGGAFGLVLALGHHWFAASLFHKPQISTALVLVGCTLPFEAVNQSYGAAFRGLRREHNYVIVTDLVRNSLVLAVVIASPRIREDITLLAATLLVGTIAQTVFGTGRLWPNLIARARSARRAAIDRSASFRAETRVLLSFSGVLFLGNFALQFSAASVLLAAPFVSARDLGIFNLFMRLLMVLTFLQSLVNNTATVEFARLHHLKDREGLGQLYLSVTTALMASATLVSLPFLADPWTILRPVSKVAAASAGLVIVVLASQLINVATGPMGTLLVACRRRAPMVIVSFVNLAVAFALFALLGKRFGLAGIVAAQAITIILVTGLRLWFGWRLLRIQAITTAFRWFAIAITIAVLAGRLADAYLGRSIGFDPAIAVTVPLGVAAAIPLYLHRLPHRLPWHRYEGKHYATAEPSDQEARGRQQRRRPLETTL
jgi:O-antigen/teichoic acid export membrane protein